MEKTVFQRQKQMKAALALCSVPLCFMSSSRYNSCASFHSFPVKEEIRKKWILNIRRINFQIENEMEIDRGHDYCSVPEPAALDLSLCENEELKREIEDLRKQLEQAKLHTSHISEYLPEEFENFRDTQVILDCTELRCQTPSSLLLQSEVFSRYKSHCTFKTLIGMAPHGAVTFLFKQSGVIDVLTPDMAIMVDKGFLIDNLVPCKIHKPAFVTKGTQMSAGEVRHTQSVARLRVHVERLIRRVKEHKLFDAVIPLSISGNINQLFAVSCLLINYQNGPLVKAWAQ
ncbi:hypothetical protein ABG768_022016 [Culter alburnus]|uniref:THAP-type domain-containing protein n=1 Tax=Culter alburnus TaxID=194366 RepID=A0AAW2ASW8_CULAL